MRCEWTGMNMKEIINAIIADFQARDVPNGVPRETSFPVMDGKASVVTGMRRSGKTWFCFQRIRALLTSGIPKTRILYINFDDERLIDFTVRDFQTILDVYYARWPENKTQTCHFFFDEIQTVNQWERFVRRLIDTENVHITVTGSSSKMLATDIATSLRGRTIVRELLPFSFCEFLAAKKTFTGTPDPYRSHDAARLRNALRDYLVCGGFPETVHCAPEMRRDILRGYVETVLFKDVVERHKISNILVLRHLIAAILSNPGHAFSVNKFFNTMKSKGIACTKNALYDYVAHLADAHFLYRLPFESESIRVQQVNPEKLYCADPALCGLLQPVVENSLGLLLETTVYLHLHRQGGHLSYYRSGVNREVDFVSVVPNGRRATLIQVCTDISNPETLKRELRAFETLPKGLAKADKLIVTLDDLKDCGNDVLAIPAWRWLLAAKG